MKIRNGMIQYPNGTVKLPDGSVKLTDGRIILPNNTAAQKLPDGSYRLSDKSLLYPDGSIKRPDGTILQLDGSTRCRDGSVITSDGTVYPPGWPAPKLLSPLFSSPKAPPGSTVYNDGSYQLPNKMIQRTDGTIDLPDGSWRHRSGQVGPLPSGQGCIGREGASEVAPGVVRQTVGGGCRSGWGRLLSVTNAIETGTWHLGALEGGGGVTSPPFQCIPASRAPA